MMSLNGHRLRLNLIANSGFIYFVLVLLVVNNSEVIAVTFDTSYIQTIEQSSNVLHKLDALDIGLYEETITTSALAFKLVDDGSEVKAHFDLRLSYLDYENNILEDTERNSLNSEVTWFITRGFYSWYFKDNYTQITLDRLDVASESNQQNVNEFVTGPRLEWHLGSSIINLDSYLALYDYSETENNNNSSVLTKLKIGKKMPSGMTLSLDYITKFVSYENRVTESDFDKQSLGLSFLYDREVNKFNAFIGRSIHDSDGSKPESSSDTRLSYKRVMSKSSYMTLAYSNRLADRNDAIETQGASLSSVFTEEKSSFEYHKSSGVSGLSIKYKKISNDVNELNESDTAISSELLFSRNISVKSQLVLKYSDKYKEIELNTDSIVESEYSKSLEYIKLFNNKMTMKIRLSELSNVSSDLQREYKDNRVSVTFSISR